MEAFNLEPITKEATVDSFVQIFCGTDKHETSVIFNNTNPHWNEAFDLYIFNFFSIYLFINFVHKKRPVRNDV